MKNEHGTTVAKDWFDSGTHLDAVSAVKGGYSVYLLTSRFLHAARALHVPKLGAVVRTFTPREAGDLESAAEHSQNPFMRRYRGERYLARISALANRTVLQVTRHGEPLRIYGNLQESARLVEALVLLCSAFSVGKGTLLRQLGISPRGNRSGFDLTLGPSFRPVWSTGYPAEAQGRILVGQQLCNRFERSGFQDLACLCLSREELGSRVRAAVSWLLESRLDGNPASAVVKTSIALESLLVVAESEPLTRALSERVAFLLGSTPLERKEISEVLRKFYGVRSAVVHGRSSPGGKRLTAEMTETVDRIAILSCLVVATSSDVWHTGADIVAWCEDLKWGLAQDGRIPPHVSRYVRLALRPLRKNARSDSARTTTRPETG